MKSRIEKNGDESFLVITGKSGFQYTIRCENMSGTSTRMCFENDLIDHIRDCIEKSMTNDDIKDHVEYKYPVCKSGLMEWQGIFKKIMDGETTKACAWTRNKIIIRVLKLLQSL